MDLPALVACDLDGTLLRTDGTVSARTIAALDRLDRTGIPFVMVTGRPIRWLDEVYEQTGPRGPAVCANGAIVYDPSTGTVLDHRPIDPDLLAEVVKGLREELPEITFAVEVEHGHRLLHERSYQVRSDAQPDWVRPAELAELLARPAVKLLARVPGHDSDVLAETITRVLGERAQATHSSYAGLIEISAAGVTKASGLAWVAERYGVQPTGIIAFGDMPNDVPMLTYVGRSVAVANAHPAVLSVAAERTVSNDEDGVAVYLEKLFGAAGN